MAPRQLHVVLLGRQICTAECLPAPIRCRPTQQWASHASTLEVYTALHEHPGSIATDTTTITLSYRTGHSGAWQEQQVTHDTCTDLCTCRLEPTSELLSPAPLSELQSRACYKVSYSLPNAHPSVPHLLQVHHQQPCPKGPCKRIRNRLKQLNSMSMAMP